jgi:hypothetical protein
MKLNMNGLNSLNAGKQHLIQVSTLKLLEKEGPLRPYVLTAVLESKNHGFKRGTIPAALGELLRTKAIEKTKDGKLKLPRKTQGARKKSKPLEIGWYPSLCDHVEAHDGFCSVAVPVGGEFQLEAFRTPDAIGFCNLGDQLIWTYYEMKVDEKKVTEALGKALVGHGAAHRWFIVIPSSTSRKIMGKVVAKCLKENIGLITFDLSTPESPNYRVIIDSTTRPVDQVHSREFFDDHLPRLVEKFPKLHQFLISK